MAASGGPQRGSLASRQFLRLQLDVNGGWMKEDEDEEIEEEESGIRKEKKLSALCHCDGIFSRGFLSLDGLVSASQGV